MVFVKILTFYFPWLTSFSLSLQPYERQGHQVNG